MPGKSKKGGGLEVGSTYKMKYQGNHSAFPFKSSTAKDKEWWLHEGNRQAAADHNALAATEEHYGEPHGPKPTKSEDKTKEEDE